jgi:ABC-type arginine/histidine transport system permease subunit
MSFLFNFLVICLPIGFFIALFVGIVKKNKRLWITSLIFLIITILLEIPLLTFNAKTTKTTPTTITTKSNNTIK